MLVMLVEFSVFFATSGIGKKKKKKKESSDLFQSCFEALYKAKSNRMNLRFL